MADISTSVVTNGQCISETSSRCLIESITATHNFELTSYPLLEGMGVDKFVTSSTFSVGGHEWNIRFYPDGTKKGTTGSSSVFLYHLSPAKDVKAKFSINILKKEGEEKVCNYGLLEHTFSLTSDNFGYRTFAKNSELKSSVDINSESLTIRCVLTVIKEPRTEVKKRLLEVPPPNLQDHLVQMLKGGEGADITFSVCGKFFNSHRYFLAARSPVFKADLFGPMKENATQVIKIDDIEPPIFEALLHFVYTDSMPDDIHDKDSKTAAFQHLLVAADRYGLHRLRVLCESKLCESLDVETVATTLVLAEQHHCEDLQEACVEFMSPRNVLQAVMATDGFKHLVASSPLLMKVILDKVSRSE